MYYIELYVKKVRRTRSMPDWTKPGSFGIIPLAEVQPMTLLPNISMQAFWKLFGIAKAMSGLNPVSMTC